MASQSQLAEDKPPALHPLETFHPSGDYKSFEALVIQPLIQRSHPPSYIYVNPHPNLPLPVTFGPGSSSLDSACRLVLENDINTPSDALSSSVYPNCPPKQSATVPIPNRVKAPGYFSPDIPGCFVTHFCGGLRKTDVVKLGDVGLRQVVVEGVEEIGRDFVQYAVHEVGPVPLESNMTTQLVAPLSNLRPFPLRLLINVYVTLFSPFVRSSVVFGADPCPFHAEAGVHCEPLEEA